MKKIIKTVLLFFVIATFFIACSDEDDDSESFAIEFVSLPRISQDLISNHFGGSKQVTFIEERYIPDTDGTYYIAYITGNKKINFNKGGVWLDIDGGDNAIPGSFLNSEPYLTSIKSYIEEMYSEQKIMEIERVNSDFKVELSNDINLLFDSGGVFKGVTN